MDYALKYLPKSTQTFGRNAEVIDGVELVVAEIPSDQLITYQAQDNPIAAQMEIEPGNYILPRDGSIPIEGLPLDHVLSELRGKLNNFDNLTEAKKRIITKLSRAAHL